jgi:tetratricopeptide (TPR) repeat protein
VAEGNPFFIQEITWAMLKDGQLFEDQETWRLPPGASLRVPAELRELLRERVQRLGATTESALTTAAVVGREFRFAILSSITQLADGELFDALDEALSAHLIEETETGYRFQHSLIRRTLYDSLSRRRRAWLHTRTGDAIEALYNERPEGLTPQIEALAYHYELSDRRDKALPYLIRAGQKATAVFALEVANDYLERASARMDELGVDDPAQRWAILEQLGSLAKILADTTRAITHYQNALALPFQTNPHTTQNGWQPKIGDRVRLHRSIARCFITAGQGNKAEDHLENAMEMMADTGPATIDYAHLLYDVALWHWHDNKYQDAYEAAQRSLDVAEQLNDNQAKAQAYEMLALACHSLGEWQQGLDFEQKRSAIIGSNLDVTEAFDAHL